MFLNVLSLVGAIMVAGGVFIASREHAWLKKAESTEGTVIELVMNRGSKGATYTPRVQFTSRDGSTHQFLRGYGSNPAGFDVGDKIQVAYDAQSFEGRIFTFGQRFGFATVFVIVGMCMIGIKAAFVVGNQFVPRIYISETSDGPITHIR